MLAAMDSLLQALHSLSSDSLCSTLVALYTVLFLYFPFLLSPVFLTTFVLLLCLLRLGASQDSQDEPAFDERRIRDLPDRYDHKRILPVQACSGFVNDPDYQESFVEWDVKAPLEVIYEEYEEGENGTEDARESDRYIIQRYASLSLFFPESDGDTSSEGDFSASGDCYSPESVCFLWGDEEEEDEDGREGLIEIELDEKRNCRAAEVEEDNLIEIDLSP